MSAALNERLVALARSLREAPHGAKGALIGKAAEELGLSRATIARKLKEVTVTKPRKQRADAGSSALTRAEAEKLAALLIVTIRKNGKRLMSLDQAVEILRSNGQIEAERVHPETGECVGLSASAIGRALRVHGLHPDQLLAAPPATSLRSPHPNHCWQIDASLCVLYYLDNGRRQAPGLQVMGEAEFYKNKPRNLARIERQRVWRYAVTDHASGALYVEYVLGAESGENLAGCFINAMQKRHDHDPFHGVPRMVMLDPGSATTGALFRNLCHALGVELIINEAGNPRAKGQVEQAHNIIERQFESGLKLLQVKDLPHLNGLAGAWMRNFNGRAIHSRHGLTRYGAWLKITPEQLVIAPDVTVCRNLAVSAPISRKVSDKLTISFGGSLFDVSTLPGVMVGQTVMVTRNPWHDDRAQIVIVGEDGRENFHLVPRLERDDFGFVSNAAEIGTEYMRHADTPAQTAAKAVEQVAMGVDTAAAIEAARKAGALPFAGRIDPYKPISDTALPHYLPRRGQAHGLVPPVVVQVKLGHVEAARRIKERVGDAWTADRFRMLTDRFPDGVPEDAIDMLAAEVTGPARVDTGRVDTGRPALALVKSA